MTTTPDTIPTDPFTPEKPYAEATGLSTGTPVKRSKKEDARYILTCDSFADEEIEYLFKAGLSSPEWIVQSYDHSRIDILLDQDAFPQGSITVLMHIAQYVK